MKYLLRLKDAGIVAGLDLPAGQLIQTNKDGLAKELCDADKAVLIRGKFKKTKTTKTQTDGTN